MKVKKGLLIFAFVCIAIGGICTMVGYVIGGGWNIGIPDMTVDMEVFEYKNDDMDAFDNLDIQLRNCRVEFRESTDDNYSVEARLLTDDTSNIVIEVRDNTLKIYNNCKSVFSLHVFSVSENEYVIISCPKDTKFGEVNIKTSNGKVEIENIDAGDNELIVSSSNGSIELSDVYAREISASTSNSSVSMSKVYAEELTVKSSNGGLNGEKIEAENIVLDTTNAKIELEEVYGVSLEATSSNGKIILKSIGFEDKMEVTTSNASIEIEVDGDMDDYSVHGSTSNADVIVNGDKKGKDYKAGNGKTTIRAKSSNGKIEIDFK